MHECACVDMYACVCGVRVCVIQGGEITSHKKGHSNTDYMLILTTKSYNNISLAGINNQHQNLTFDIPLLRYQL